MESLLWQPDLFMSACKELEANLGSLSEIHSLGQPWQLATCLSATDAMRSADQVSLTGKKVGPFCQSVPHSQDAIVPGFHNTLFGFC